MKRNVRIEYIVQIMQYGVTKREFAKIIGVNEKVFYKFLEGYPVNAEITQDIIKRIDEKLSK